jgi:hypothetical protein
MYTECIEEVFNEYQEQKAEEIEKELISLFLFGPKDKYLLKELFFILSSYSKDEALIFNVISSMIQKRQIKGIDPLSSSYLLQQNLAYQL